MDDNIFGEFDTTGVSELSGFELLPAGKYPAILTSATRKPTKDQTGAFAECVYTIIEGAYTGKRFTSRLNLWNSNQDAVRIAKSELKSMRKALGLPDNEGRLSAFLSQPMVLDITLTNRKENGRPTAELQNNLNAIDQYKGPGTTMGLVTEVQVIQQAPRQPSGPAAGGFAPPPANFAPQPAPAFQAPQPAPQPAPAPQQQAWQQPQQPAQQWQAPAANQGAPPVNGAMQPTPAAYQPQQGGQPAWRR